MSSTNQSILWLFGLFEYLLLFSLMVPIYSQDSTSWASSYLSNSHSMERSRSMSKSHPHRAPSQSFPMSKSAMLSPSTNNVQSTLHSNPVSPLFCQSILFSYSATRSKNEKSHSIMSPSRSMSTFTLSFQFISGTSAHSAVVSRSGTISSPSLDSINFFSLSLTPIQSQQSKAPPVFSRSSSHSNSGIFPPLSSMASYASIHHSVLFSSIALSSPYNFPTPSPTKHRNEQPSNHPTIQPSSSDVPTSRPTARPTAQPTVQPSVISIKNSTAPSSTPTSRPTSQSTSNSTSSLPSILPTEMPSVSPTLVPSNIPTLLPTLMPSFQPTVAPSPMPSMEPTSMPSMGPTPIPSMGPTPIPSMEPTPMPSSQNPTFSPTRDPSFFPSPLPSTAVPVRETAPPIAQPTVKPSPAPSVAPSALPTVKAGLPTESPTSATPTVIPTRVPSAAPSLRPTAIPTAAPTKAPRPDPSRRPTAYPTVQPTTSAPTPASLRPVQLSCSVTMILSNISLSQFSENYMQTAFVAAVVNSIRGLSASDVNIAASVSPSAAQRSGTITFAIAEGSSLIVTILITVTTVQAYSDPLYSGFKSNITEAVVTGSFGASLNSNIQAFNPSGTILLQPVVDKNNVGVSQASVVQITSAPTAMPVTAAPTISPTAVVPLVSGLSAVAISTTTITVRVSLKSNVDNPGAVFCIATTSTPKDVGAILFSSYSKAYVTVANPVDVAVGGLRPLSRYTVYCAVKTLFNNWNSLADVRSVYVNVSTPCCYSIITNNAPYQVYGDISAYSTGDTSYLFEFALQYPPRNDVTLTPYVQYLNGTKVASAIVAVKPSSPVRFSSTAAGSKLSFQFFLSADKYLTQTFLVGFDISGQSAADFAPLAPLETAIISSSTPAAAPFLVSAVFDDSGSYIHVYFDKATNLAGISAAKWDCSLLFLFSGVGSSSCSWINASHAIITSAVLLPSDTVTVDSTLTLLPEVLKVFCSGGSFACPNDYYSYQQSVTIAYPENAITPVVIIKAAGTISTCDALSLDATATYGNGGRLWTQSYWTISDSTDTDSGANMIGSFLDKQDISQRILIPASYLYSGTITFTLTVGNFLGAISSGKAVVVVGDNGFVPLVSILGSQSVSMLRSDALQLTAAASLSSCATAASATMVYSWTVVEDGVKAFEQSSTSANPKVYALNAYSLSVSSYYSVTFTASLVDTKSNILGSSFATATVFVVSGPVAAFIAGGSFRSVPVSSPFTLDGSKSVDSNVNPKSAVTTLQYSWSCTIASKGEDFLKQCLFMQSVDTLSSTLQIPAGAMTAGVYYSFSLLVSTTDGRQDEQTVSILATGIPIQVYGLSSVSRVNEDSSLTAYGRFVAPVDVVARWTVYFGTVNFSATFLTPSAYAFSAAEASLSVQFPAGIAGGSLVGGRSYSIQLQVCESQYPTRCAFSQIAVAVNAPPSGGSIVPSPREGAALSQLFTFNAIDWIDEPSDYPLNFGFSYLIASSLPASTIGSIGPLSYVTSILPSGLSALSNAVEIICTISDNYDARAMSYTNVTVFAASTQSLDFVSSLLKNSTDLFASTGDADGLLQIINGVSSTINVQNCSLAMNCVALNREECLSTPQTCGSCLDGFKGVIGDSNLACFNASVSKLAVGAVCVTDDECEYGICGSSEDASNRMCGAPSKSCPSNDPLTVCSGHGRCGYFDVSGNAVGNCTVVNVYCTARCSCDEEYGDQDCSLTASDLESLDSSRQAMCKSLYAAAKAQDKSAKLLDTMVASLLQSFSPYQVTSAAGISACLDLLEYLSLVASEDSNLAKSLPKTSSFLGSVISSFVTSSTSVTGTARSQQKIAIASSTISTVESAVNNFVTGLSGSQVNGQVPQTVVSPNMRLTVGNYLVSSLANLSLAAPQTAEEVAYGSLPPKLTLSGSAFGACDFSTGYAPMSIMQWGTNPYPGSGAMISPVLKLTTTSTPGPSNQGGRKLLDSIVVPTVGIPLYFVSLQFSSPLQLNFSNQRLGVGKANVTLPECQMYDGASYVPCNGCNISSYTDFNVTYACYDITTLCSLGSQGRRLAFSDDDSGGNGLTSAASFTALAKAIGAELRSVLSVSHINLQQAKAVLIFVGMMLFTIMVGIVLTIRYDSWEHNKFVYIYEASEEIKDVSNSARQNKSIFEIIEGAFRTYPLVPVPIEALEGEQTIGTNSESFYTPQKSAKFNVGEENAASVDFDAFFQSLRDDDESNEAQQFPKEDVAIQDAKSTGIRTEQSILERAEGFVNTALVAHDTLMEGKSILRVLYLVMLKHEYVNFFAEWNAQLSRCIRWLGLWRGILIGLFIDTLFFGIYFKDTGNCASFTTRASCELQPSSFSSTGTQCVWDSNECLLSPPPQNITFAIILSLVCVLLSAPIDFMLGYVLEEYCAKLPNLKDIGWSVEYWFGSTDTNMLGVDIPRHFSEPVQSNLGEYLREKDPSVLESRELAALCYDDLLSPAEEVTALLQKIRKFYFMDVENPGWTANKDSDVDRQARAAAIANILGVQSNGVPLPLPLIQRLFYVDAVHKLESKISTVRRECEDLLSWLSGYRLEEVQCRDFVLVQNFILEQLPTFKRFALRKQFFFYKRVSPDIIPLHEWVISWLVILCSYGFFLAWIFLWGVQNGGTTLRAWGINFGIGLAQDIAFQKPVKALIIYVLAVEVMRPQLRAIRSTLIRVAMRCANGGQANEELKVVQYMSASCRLARRSTAFHLPSALLLRMVNDSDVELCHAGRDSHIATIFLILIAIPAILAVAGDAAGDNLLEVVIQTFSSGMILFFSVLHGFGPLVVAAPFIGLAGWYLYQYRMVKPSQRHLEKAKYRSFVMRQNGGGAMQTRSSRRQLISRIQHDFARLVTWLSELSSLVSNPWAIMERYNAKHQQVSRTWRLMNSTIPTENGESTAVQSVSLYSLLINIPAPILSMVSQSGSGASTSGLNPSAPSEAESRVVFRNDLQRTPIMQEFQARQIVSDPYVALQRIVGDRFDRGQLEAVLTDESYLIQHTGATAKGPVVNFDELERELVSVWSHFFPTGIQLISDEIGEVHSKYLADIGFIQDVESNVNILQFCSWFLELCNSIEQNRLRGQ